MEEEKYFKAPKVGDIKLDSEIRNVEDITFYGTLKRIVVENREGYADYIIRRLEIDGDQRPINIHGARLQSNLRPTGSMSGTVPRPLEFTHRGKENWSDALFLERLIESNIEGRVVSINGFDSEGPFEHTMEYIRVTSGFFVGEEYSFNIKPEERL